MSSGSEGVSASSVATAVNADRPAGSQNLSALLVPELPGGRLREEQECLPADLVEPVDRLALHRR